MFDVYKSPKGQLFPRKLVGSFDRVEEIPEKTGLDPDTVCRLCAGERVDGYEIDISYKLLRTTSPMVQEQIGKRLGIASGTVGATVHHALAILKKAGTLRMVLEMIRELRELESREGNHGGLDCEIEMSTTIKIHKEN